MIELSQFDEPWTLRTLGMLLYVLGAFDVTGFFIRHKWFSRESDELRLADWFWGFSVFAFIWFIVGYFVAPQGWLVGMGFLLPYALFAKYYWNQSGLKSMGKALKDVSIFLIPLVFFLPAFAIKTSLPPYYSDEMAYHFVSPAYLQNLKTFDWLNLQDFSVFNFIPKSLDIFYILFFSMTKTNVLSRAVNSLFFFSSFLVVCGIVKKRFGLLFPLMFLILFLSVPQSLVKDATVGFVDIPSTSLRFLGFVSGTVAVLESSWPLFIFSLGTWSLALATKYASMTGFAVFLLLLGSWSFFFNKEFIKSMLSIKKVGSIAAVGFFVGGFWYFKNLLVTGNPIFPFLLPCYRFKENCGTGSEFFGTWTIAVKRENFATIANEFFRGQGFFYILLGIGLLTIFFKFGRKIRPYFMLIAGAFLLEMTIFAKTSGFYLRYHQHLQYLIIFLCSLPFALFVEKKKYVRLPILILAVVSIFIVGAGFQEHVRQTYQSHMSPEEKQYFLRKIDIYGFVNYRFKGKEAFIRWCEKNKAVVQRYDPDLIWYDDAAYIHQFMTNCFFEGQKFTVEMGQKEIVDKILNEKVHAYIFSANACQPQSEVKLKYGNEDENSLKLRRLNNRIVCCAKPVDNMVYELSYLDLKCNAADSK